MQHTGSAGAVGNAVPVCIPFVYHTFLYTEYNILVCMTECWSKLYCYCCIVDHTWYDTDTGAIYSCCCCTAEYAPGSVSISLFSLFSVSLVFSRQVQLVVCVSHVLDVYDANIIRHLITPVC